jgi:hypothetical protein
MKDRDVHGWHCVGAWMGGAAIGFMVAYLAIMMVQASAGAL